MLKSWLISLTRSDAWAEDGSRHRVRLRRVLALRQGEGVPRRAWGPARGHRPHDASRATRGPARADGILLGAPGALQPRGSGRRRRPGGAGSGARTGRVPGKGARGARRAGPDDAATRARRDPARRRRRPRRDAHAQPPADAPPPPRRRRRRRAHRRHAERRPLRVRGDDTRASIDRARRRQRAQRVDARRPKAMLHRRGSRHRAARQAPQRLGQGSRRRVRAAAVQRAGRPRGRRFKPRRAQNSFPRRPPRALQAPAGQPPGLAEPVAFGVGSPRRRRARSRRPGVAVRRAPGGVHAAVRRTRRRDEPGGRALRRAAIHARL